MKATDVYKAIAFAASLTVAGLLATQLVTVLLGAIIAVILAMPLAAAADRAERLGLPRAVGALLALALLVAVIAGLAIAIVPSFVNQARDFAKDLPSLVNGIERRLGSIKGLDATRISSDLRHIVNDYANNPQRLAGPLGQAGTTALVAIVGLVVVVGTAFGLAVRPEPVIGFALRLIPSAQRPLMRDVMRRVRKAWLGWMEAVAIDMVVLGTLLYIGMTIVGLPFAVGFATFSAVMTIIPNYGSIVSAIPPVLAGLAHSPGKAALVLLVYVIVNQIEGNLILPLIMARTVDIHPAVVAIGLLVMAALFGVIGVFIAIPLLSLTIILVQALWIEQLEAA